MRILYVADGRSPIASHWMSGMLEAGHEVHLVSSYPFETQLGFASTSVVPLAFSGSKTTDRSAKGAGGLKNFAAGMLGGAGNIRLRNAVRHWVGPFTVGRAAGQLQKIIETVDPDIVHALRIPFEGMAAAAATQRPLVISVWGNDFTLHAGASPGMRRLTRRALQRTDALLTDCKRDQRLAISWGFLADRPALVVPGGGGVRFELFNPAAQEAVLETSSLGIVFRGIAPEAPIVVNPRGFRAYVRNDTFFRAIPHIRARFPETQFMCVAMAADPLAIRWLDDLGIHSGVHLLPKLSAPEMAVLFRKSWVSVSPSEHDGTPNTLLEAMAAGAYPVAGDLESIREWLEDGVNGSLVDPGDQRAFAESVIEAIDNKALRDSAAKRNTGIVDSRARYDETLLQVEALYQNLAAQKK